MVHPQELFKRFVVLCFQEFNFCSNLYSCSSAIKSDGDFSFMESFIPFLSPPCRTTFQISYAQKVTGILGKMPGNALPGITRSTVRAEPRPQTYWDWVTLADAMTTPTLTPTTLKFVFRRK